MKTKKLNPKIKIESVYVESAVDENAENSFMGEYTTKPSPWAIDRKRNDFVCKLEQRERIIEKLHEKLDEHADETDTPEYAILLEKTRVRIKKIRDSFPDDSYIERNSFEYFKPYAGGEKPGTKDYRKYAWRDYNRMEKLNRGDFWFLGIIAKAKILVPTDNPGESQLQTITSHGCWGIESDARDYIAEVAKKQLEELKQQLMELGIGERACDYAIKRWNGEIISR